MRRLRMHERPSLPRGLSLGVAGFVLELRQMGGIRFRDREGSEANSIDGCRGYAGEGVPGLSILSSRPIPLPLMLRAVAEVIEKGEYPAIKAVAVFEEGHHVVGLCMEDIVTATQHLIETLRKDGRYPD